MYNPEPFLPWQFNKLDYAYIKGKKRKLVLASTELDFTHPSPPADSSRTKDAGSVCDIKMIKDVETYPKGKHEQIVSFIQIFNYMF